MLNTPSDSSEYLLEVQNLKTHFFRRGGVVKAVDGVDFAVRKGEVFCLVGESGCGKTVSSLSLMRLVSWPGRIVEGSVKFDGVDLLALPESRMVGIRGNQISVIFQNPQASLDPVYKVGDQIVETILLHRKTGRKDAWQRSVELLELVGIPDAERRAHSYPFELSGGMAQRVMIAMALACEPKLLIADEPTTALDVTIQAQILDLLRDLRARLGMTIILITHDLGVVAELADRVGVMYAGQIVEETDVATLFADPLHPYTRGLISSIPVLDQAKDRLATIPGTVPNCVNLPSGCRFASRCSVRVERGMAACTQLDPRLRPGSGHSVRCWLYEDVEQQGDLRK